MPVVRGVPVPVVNVVKVIVVRDGTMPAAIAVDMVVFGRIVRPVPLGVRGHVGRLLPRMFEGRSLQTTTHHPVMSCACDQGTMDGSGRQSSMTWSKLRVPLCAPIV